MGLSRVYLRNFTAFREIDIAFSEGLNVFVGANGTGKTHLMKVLYSACDITKSDVPFARKLYRVFLPSEGRLGRLVRREKKSSRCELEVYRYGYIGEKSEKLRLYISFSNHIKSSESERIRVVGERKWRNFPVEGVYIPVKEMLSNAPGFLSLYRDKEIHFSEVYADIINKAFKPPLKGPISKNRRKLLAILSEFMEGNVKIVGEEFFLVSKGEGMLEFTLLAEGLRKLALLWLLIQNGTLEKGNVLFWDEPEANLNPALLGPVVEILLELQRMGVQIFLTTHSYFVLKEIDLRTKPTDKVKFYSFYKDECGDVKVSITNSYKEIHPNTITETFMSIYDRDLTRRFSG